MGDSKQTASEFVYQGWRKKQIPVPRIPGAAPITEVRCTPYGDFFIRGVIDTPTCFERGPILCWPQWARFVRVVVPKQYTHVELQPASRSSSFPTRCRARFADPRECDELLTSASGQNWDVLRYQGPPATAVLEFKGGPGHSNVEHFSFDGTRSTMLANKHSPFRGTIQIPGPGLIQINQEGPWHLELQS